MQLIDFFLNKAIHSGFLKSRVQAWARAGALAGSGWLVEHGLATNSTATIIVGAVTAIVAAYLQDLDVKIVDGKIKIALITDSPTVVVTAPNVVVSPTVTVEPSPAHQTPAQEIEETKNLNKAQLHGSYTHSVHVTPSPSSDIK